MQGAAHCNVIARCILLINKTACRALNRTLINLTPRTRRNATPQPALEHGIQAVLQTATVFRQNIVQGLPNEQGHYGQSRCPSQNIHLMIKCKQN